MENNEKQSLMREIALFIRELTGTVKRANKVFDIQMELERELKLQENYMPSTRSSDILYEDLKQNWGSTLEMDEESYPVPVSYSFSGSSSNEYTPNYSECECSLCCDKKSR